MKKRETVSITIRLPKDIVNQIDKKVDGIEYRTRTHVIEKALAKLIDSEK